MECHFEETKTKRVVVIEGKEFCVIYNYLDSPKYNFVKVNLNDFVNIAIPESALKLLHEAINKYLGNTPSIKNV